MINEKDRAAQAMKRDFQLTVGHIRKSLGMKEFPKPVTRAALREGGPIRCEVHCGYGFVRSREVASLVMHHKAMIDFAARHGARIVVRPIICNAAQRVQGDTCDMRHVVALGFEGIHGEGAS